MSATCVSLASAKPPSQAQKDRQVVAFFKTHPRLARTPAGQLALLRIEVRRLGVAVRALQALRARVPLTNEQEARKAIEAVFGPYAAQAMAVAYCETGGTYDPRATNGQYLGIFQMGDYARGRYGHSDSWLGQARAAYAYFVDAGRDWSPWECQP